VLFFHCLVLSVLLWLCLLSHDYVCTLESVCFSFVLFLMCPFSSQIACLSRLLCCWTFEGKNEQLSFELSPGLKYLFCSVGPTRHLRTPLALALALADDAGVGRFTYFPGAVPEISLDHPQGSIRLAWYRWYRLSDHFNLLLTVIPRYDAESTCSSLDPQKKNWPLRRTLLIWNTDDVAFRMVKLHLPLMLPGF